MSSLCFLLAKLLIATSVTNLPPLAQPTGPAVGAQGSGYGSTGVHGALVVPSGQTRVINLSSEGTYDAVNWVVRFDYTSVDIGNNATVTFVNHPSRAPVAWIVQGNVTVGQGALVNLSGAASTTGLAGSTGYAEPGPGGFRGGRASATGYDDVSSAGFGPGGARGNPNDTSSNGSGGGYRENGGLGGSQGVNDVGTTYGGPAIFQLIGGSGGGGGRNTGQAYNSSGGGAGGGALLIATDGAIAVYGSIRSKGGAITASGTYGGAGAGGAIRLASLVQVTVGPTGALDVTGALANNGGAGGDGRIRIESPGIANIQGSVSAFASYGVPEPAFRTSPPRLRVTSIGGQATPPEGGLQAGLGFAGESADMLFFDPGAVDIVVDSENLPLGSLVYLRITRAKAHATVLGPLTLSSGTSVTFTNVDLSAGFAALQARAVLPQP